MQKGHFAIGSMQIFGQSRPCRQSDKLSAPELNLEAGEPASSRLAPSKPLPTLCAHWLAWPYYWLQNLFSSRLPVEENSAMHQCKEVTAHGLASSARLAVQMGQGPPIGVPRCLAVS